MGMDKAIFPSRCPHLRSIENGETSVELALALLLVAVAASMSAAGRSHLNMDLGFLSGG